MKQKDSEQTGGSDRGGIEGIGEIDEGVKMLDIMIWVMVT